MVRLKDVPMIVWIVVVAALVAVAAILVTGALLRSTATYAARTSVGAGQGCWSLIVSVDGGAGVGYLQCGGEASRTTDVGRCAEAVHVIARPNYGTSTVTVEILKDGVVVQSGTFADGGPSGTQFVDHSC